MDFKREWYVGFDKEQGFVTKVSNQVGIREYKRFTWRNPDLLCVHKEYGFIIIELDGAIHDRKVKKTIQRNLLYTGAGIKLVVLNIADIKENTDTIEGELTERIEWIISNHSS